MDTVYTVKHLYKSVMLPVYLIPLILKLFHKHTILCSQNPSVKNSASC